MRRPPATCQGAVPPVTEPSHAVFLSYASQDAEAAQRICDALRAAKIEVWFDQSELRGGDAWDQRIRREIRDCALFIPIISAQTQKRPEGYFRLEWKIAVDRSHFMTSEKAFLLPIVIDATQEAGAFVPDRFREVQWTHIPGGAATAAFAERVARLLDQPLGERAAPYPRPESRRSRSRPAWLWAVAGLCALVAGYFVLERFGSPKRAAERVASPVGSAPQLVAERSVAVLPFLDMSEKKDQEYFSDGLAEELIDLLAKTPGLHVIARTSSFSFKGKAVDIPTIGRKLMVATILEGSVRKAGDHLRVTTELVRGATGESMWSESYDRQVKDIFKVQDEIAGAVLAVLRIKLAGGHLRSGPSQATSSPDAYHEYLVGRQFVRQGTLDGMRRAIESYQRAVGLDPHYAVAYAALAAAEYRVADETADAAGIERAKSSAARAISEGPEQPEGYAIRGAIRSRVDWDWPGAQVDLEKAMALDPGDSAVQHSYGTLLGLLGRFPEATEALTTATRLDPLSSAAFDDLGLVLMANHDSRDAFEAFRRELEIQPDDSFGLDNLANLQLITGHPSEALATYRKIGDEALRNTGIAMAEYSLGHGQLSQQALAAAVAKGGEGYASQIADVYAWRHEMDKAFEWLQRAYDQHDGGLAELNTDLLITSLHGDSRYKALRRQINLPD